MIDGKNGTSFRDKLATDSAKAGGAVVPHPDDASAVGKTLFDLPGSTDLTVTVVVPKDQLHAAPAQSLVRIKSRTDGRAYLGVVTAGPFAEPDGLRGDSPMLTAVATHGGDYLPPYHGRFQVTILGEELKDGALVPPRLRPVPNSPVFVLDDAEAGKVLKCGGAVRLGARSRSRERGSGGAGEREGGVPAAHRDPGHDRRRQIDHRRGPDRPCPGGGDGSGGARRGGRVHGTARADRPQADAHRSE